MPRQVLIDWHWGASGIWTVRDPDERFTPATGGRWAPHKPPRDRHRAWRGRLSDDLIDRLQTWNEDGDVFMGRRAHQHTDAERTAFWRRGQELAEQVQTQLGDEYEVLCRTPANFPELIRRESAPSTNDQPRRDQRGASGPLLL